MRAAGANDPVSDFLGMVTRFKRMRYEDRSRPSIPFRSFRQEVRRYRPSQLLPALAKLSATVSDTNARASDMVDVPPWMTATAARESLLWGNEYRSAEVTGEALRKIANAHSNIYEGDPEPSPQGVLDMMTRLAYEQFPYQESIFEEVTRTHALMIEGAKEVKTEVIGETAWDAVFGAPLEQIVGATFFLHVAANSNHGWFDPQWVDREDLSQIFALWPSEVIRRRSLQLSATIDEFREAYHNVPKPPVGYERYAYNPLLRRPFIRMPDGRLLAPQSRLILRTVSPGVIHHEGLSALGAGFTRDLGRLTENYVGRLLRSALPSSAVLGEIEYRIKKQTSKSVDWIVVLPNVVILVEVKSARYGLLERAAVDGYRERVSGLLNKALGQLVRSSEQIDVRNPDFAHVPADRPRVGLIVTGEPFYLANSPWFRELLEATPFPVLTASLREVEVLTSLGPEDVSQQLLSIASDQERSTWSLGNAMRIPPGTTRNRVLDRAWAAYPWPALGSD